MVEKAIRTFTDLNTWKEGHALCLAVYRKTQNFPREEIFGLTNQMRRCAVSIVSNVAEGFGRQSYREKLQFYSVSQGSNLELQAQLLVSRDVGFLSNEDFTCLSEQSLVVGKLLTGLIKKTKAHLSKG